MACLIRATRRGGAMGTSSSVVPHVICCAICRATYEKYLRRPIPVNTGTSPLDVAPRQALRHCSTSQCFTPDVPGGRQVLDALVQLPDGVPNVAHHLQVGEVHRVDHCAEVVDVDDLRSSQHGSSHGPRRQSSQQYTHALAGLELLPWHHAAEPTTYGQVREGWHHPQPIYSYCLGWRQLRGRTLRVSLGCMKKGGFSTTSWPTMMIRSACSIATCT